MDFRRICTLMAMCTSTAAQTSPDLRPLSTDRLDKTESVGIPLLV